jgi:phospholipid/cholesterol/gamma-HCH transport system ATP-binding protein
LTAPALLQLEAARGEDPNLPQAAMDLELSAGDFALIETPGLRSGAVFADLCSGLVPLAAGRVRFLGRDWSSIPDRHADALRGRIGRLFHQPLRADTPDVAARVLLARLHHTRMAESVLRAEAAALALRFGLPGLPVGPTRLLSGPDLLRAACVRAFLGEPALLILELTLAAEHEALRADLLAACAEARGRGAGVMWLVPVGPVLRDRSIRPTHRLRLHDAGLTPVRRPAVAA